MSPKFFLLTATTATILLASTAARAGHVYGGLIDTNGTPGLQNGDALSFVSQTTGAPLTSLTLANSTLVTAPDNPQTGLFRSTGPTFTGLAATGLAWEGSAYLPANSFAATSGSFLRVRLADVTGPVGAEFSFWDSGALTPTSTYVVGQGLTLGTSRITVTDENVFIGDGTTPNPTTLNSSPTVDPYGHLHGRSFTVNQPGTYTVRYILEDAAGHHPDSAPFVVTYNAVPESGTLALIALAGVVVFVLLRRRSAHLKS